MSHLASVTLRLGLQTTSGPGDEVSIRTCRELQPAMFRRCSHISELIGEVNFTCRRGRGGDCDVEMSSEEVFFLVWRAPTTIQVVVAYGRGRCKTHSEQVKVGKKVYKLRLLAAEPDSQLFMVGKQLVGDWVLNFARSIIIVALGFCLFIFKHGQTSATVMLVTIIALGFRLLIFKRGQTSANHPNTGILRDARKNDHSRFRAGRRGRSLSETTARGDQDSEFFERCVDRARGAAIPARRKKSHYCH